MISEDESILFLVSEDDTLKFENNKNISYEIIMTAYCEKVRKNLNTILGVNAQIRHHQKQNNNG
ncbi:MAG: hypothetical protein KF816_11370 [Melioribacteraceae bacterium]|nr:hypothetical protein [Melioribacteraceae bacterium]RJR06645.1 MAG: hypothetical protein C4588_07535 [Candidatus Parcubacteria bacterium]